MEPFIGHLFDVNGRPIAEVRGEYQPTGTPGTPDWKGTFEVPRGIEVGGGDTLILRIEGGPRLRVITSMVRVTRHGSDVAEFLYQGGPVSWD